MKEIVPVTIEHYCTEHTTPESRLLQELAAETYAITETPQMQIGHLEGALLKMLVRLVKAKRVLEIGTFTGYSALVMAEALPEDGSLITCDNNPDVTEMAQRCWNRSPHGKKIKLRFGEALETLATLQGPFDMVFIDADKENYINYWEICIPKVRAGGIVVADNVLWGGQVLAPENLTDRAIAAFNEYVCNDRSVEVVMLPIRDGLTLAWKLC